MPIPRPLLEYGVFRSVGPFALVTRVKIRSAPVLKIIIVRSVTVVGWARVRLPRVSQKTPIVA